MNKLLENCTPVDNFRPTKEAGKGLDLEQSTHEKLNDKSSINSAAVVVCHHSSFKVDESQGKTKESNQRETKFWNFIKQHKVLLWVERIFLFSVCTAVAGAFTVPIIIYSVSTDKGNHVTAQFSSDLDFDSCSNTAAQLQVCK